MMRRALFLLLLSACLPPATHTAEPGSLGVGQAAGLRQAAVEVTTTTPRELPAPRPGVREEVVRVVTGRKELAFSTADAFSSAIAATLRAKGVEPVAGGRPGVAVLRVTIADFEIRNHDTAGAVAFISARYRLVAPDDGALWETTQTRLPIRLGGPDLTRSEVMRIAQQVVRLALASFPDSVGR